MSDTLYVHSMEFHGFRSVNSGNWWLSVAAFY